MSEWRRARCRIAMLGFAAIAGSFVVGEVRAQPDPVKAAEPVRFSGRLVDEAGKPVPGWLVELRPVPEWFPCCPSVETDAQGSFAAQVRDGVRYSVCASPLGLWPGPPLTRPLEPSAGPFRVEVRAKDVPRARVRCSVVTAEGTPVPSSGIKLRGRSGCWAAMRQESEAVVSTEVAPDVYTVVVDGPGRAGYEFPAFEVRDADVSLGRLTVPPLRKLRVKVAGTGVGGTLGIFRLYTSQGARWSNGGQVLGSSTQQRAKKGDEVEQSVTPGLYLVRINGAQICNQQFEVEVTGERDRECTLDATAAVYRNLAFEFPGRMPEAVHLVVSRNGGACVLDAVVAAPFEMRLPLAAGSFLVDAEREDQTHVVGAFEITAGGEDSIRVRLAPRATKAEGR